jgi:hypothetical protein
VTTSNSSTNAYLPDPGLQKQAEAAIVRFEQSPAPSVWAHLSKPQILTEIKARVKNPFQINQGGQPFCGPASVLFELIRKQPARYVELCQSLFLVGGFHTTSGRWITAPDRLRNVSKGELHMPQVDWMVLATLREAETYLFPVEPNAPDIIRNLAGMTKSWEMKGWVKEILGYPQVEYNHAYLGGDLNALQQAQAAIAAGGVAFALITAEGMLTNNPPPVAFPTHWIVLLGGITQQNGRIGFDIYTWSRQMRVDLSEGDFKRFLWAIVTSKS